MWPLQARPGQRWVWVWLSRPSACAQMPCLLLPCRAVGHSCQIFLLIMRIFSNIALSNAEASRWEPSAASLTWAHGLMWKRLYHSQKTVPSLAWALRSMGTVLGLPPARMLLEVDAALLERLTVGAPASPCWKLGCRCPYLLLQ